MVSIPNGRRCIQNIPGMEASVWLTILKTEACDKKGAQSLVGPDVHKRSKVKAPSRLKQDWILSSSIYEEQVTK